MTSINLKPLVGPSILTILICVGFWLYARWDTQRFAESLPKVLAVQTETTGTTSAQQAASPDGATQTTEIAIAEDLVRNIELKNPEDDAMEQKIGAAATIEARAGTVNLNALLEEFLEETTANAIILGDSINVAQDASYDQALMKRGFADYNAYLKTNPEYAYQRLEEAFREQYNDDPDVSRLVETIRESNEGLLTINEEIQSIEFMMRFLSKTSPPKPLKGLKTICKLSWKLSKLERVSYTRSSLSSESSLG